MNRNSVRFICCLSIALSLVVSGWAQQYNPKGGQYGSKKKTKYRRTSTTLKRNKTDVFPLEPIFKLGGFSLALGGTYMLPTKEGEGRSVFLNGDTTITQSYAANARGKLGAYAEVGWFHSFVNPSFFHFVDGAIAYKMLRGRESVQSTTNVYDALNNVSVSSNQSYEPDFSDQLVSARIDFTNHRHFSRYGFIQNGIGVNVDYAFSKSRRSTPTFPAYQAEFREDLIVQLHYRLGVGWKATPSLLIVPTLELPLVTAYPFENGKSSLAYFSSRFYPMILSIRFMFLRYLNDDCKVPNYDGPANFN